MFQLGDAINTRFWRVSDTDPSGGRLRELVEERSTRFTEIVQKYSRLWATAGPTNTSQAEAAIHHFYTIAELPAPKKIVWFDSPPGALLAAALLCWRDNEDGRFWPDFSTAVVGDEVFEHHIGPTFLLPNFRRVFDIPSRAETEFLCSSIERRFAWDLDVPLIFSNAAVLQQAHDEMRHQIRDAAHPIDAWLDVWMDVEEQLIDTPLDTMWDKLGCRLWALEDNEQTDILWDLSSDFFAWLYLHACRGRNDAIACAMYECLELVGPLTTRRGLEALISCVVAGVSFWPLADICVACKRPTEFHVNSNWHLHRNDGLAVRYPDGWGLHALGGIPVSEDIAYGRFTLQDIEKQFNVEMRRVMIERYGVADYLLGTGCKVKHRDKFGTLYHKQMGWEDEPIQMVEVQNSTPERDGSFKKYFLRVPPDMETARQAVAWTFGLSERDYNPSEES